MMMIENKLMMIEKIGMIIMIAAIIAYQLPYMPVLNYQLSIQSTYSLISLAPINIL